MFQVRDFGLCLLMWAFFHLLTTLFTTPSSSEVKTTVPSMKDRSVTSATTGFNNRADCVSILYLGSVTRNMRSTEAL